MNKRKVVLYISLLAIIIGGAPYVTGYLVETKFQDVVKVASEFDPINITILEYQRGWRKSYAKTRVTFKGKYLHKLVSAIEGASPNQTNPHDATLSVILAHEIRHGPFVQLKDGNYKDWLFALAGIRSGLFLTESAKKTLTSEVGDPELLSLHGEMTIEGAVRAKIESKALKWKETPTTERLIWKGMHGDWQLSKDMKQLTGEMILPGFDFDWDNKRYFAEECIFKTQRFKTAEGMWLGKGTLTANKIEITDQQKATITLMGLTAGGVIDLKQGMLDSSGTLNIEQLKIDGKQYGPMNYVFSLKNLESNATRSLLEILNKAKLDDKLQQAAYLQNIVVLLPDLLKARPEFNLDALTIHTNEGDVKGYLNIAVGGSDANNVNNPPQIIRSIVAKGSLLMPKSLLKELLTAQYTKAANALNDKEKQLNNPEVSQEELTQKIHQQTEETITKQVSEGMLVDKENHFLIEITFVNGQLKINGKDAKFPSQMPNSSPATSQLPAQKL